MCSAFRVTDKKTKYTEWIGAWMACQALISQWARETRYLLSISQSTTYLCAAAPFSDPCALLLAFCILFVIIIFQRNDKPYATFHLHRFQCKRNATETNHTKMTESANWLTQTHWHDAGVRLRFACVSFFSIRDVIQLVWLWHRNFHCGDLCLLSLAFVSGSHAFWCLVPRAIVYALFTAFSILNSALSFVS